MTVFYLLTILMIGDNCDFGAEQIKHVSLMLQLLNAASFPSYRWKSQIPHGKHLTTKCPVVTGVLICS